MQKQLDVVPPTSPSEDVAFILAGGKGIRMRRLGEYLPKCLLVVYDQPLVVRHLESCRQAGLKTAYLSVSRRHKELVSAIVRPIYDELAVPILVDESQPGPILALAEAADLFAGQGCALVLGDIYLEQGKFWEKLPGSDRSKIILSTYRERDVERITAGCNVELDGDRIVRIREKPRPEEIRGNLCWTGLCYLPAAFFREFPSICTEVAARGAAHLGEVLQLALERGIEVISCMEEGEVCNLTRPDDLILANILELRKIHRLRPNEKQPLWDSLRQILSEDRK